MKTRSLFFITALIVSSKLFATDNAISGEIRELSISPDGSILLPSDAGILYKLDNISAPLTELLKLPEPKPDYFGEKHINIDRVSFFNRDTFFISGYLGEDLIGEETGTTNKIFLTKDGGKNWEMVTFAKGGIWIYDVVTHSNGEAWMGGSSGDIYYSKDFGSSWEKQASPFDNANRSAAIFINGQNGMVGALENKLMFSIDGFKSFKSLKTPLDQKKYKESGDIPDNRFNQVAIFNNNYIVTQSDYVFYSPTEKISWTAFDPELEKFAINGSKLIGVSEDKVVYQFSEKFEIETNLASLPSNENVIDLKVVNNVIYVLTAKYKPHSDDDEVVGTIAGLVITKVGARKVESYQVYTITDGKLASATFEVAE